MPPDEPTPCFCLLVIAVQIEICHSVKFAKIHCPTNCMPKQSETVWSLKSLFHTSQVSERTIGLLQFHSFCMCKHQFFLLTHSTSHVCDLASDFPQKIKNQLSHENCNVKILKQQHPKLLSHQLHK